MSGLILIQKQSTNKEKKTTIMNIYGKLDEIIAIQCADGNWNYNNYNFGLANGLLLAKSILTGDEPVFMNTPDEWLCDKPDPIPEEIKTS